jgi:hypothetical protein
MFARGALNPARKGAPFQTVSPSRLKAHASKHTQHHDRPSYALMAFCQSIITLVAR